MSDKNKDSEYRIYFYKHLETGRVPVKEYLEQLSKKDRTKVLKYIEYLRVSSGYLDEPYSRHISGKIRELRVDFARNRHRIFYFCFIGKKLVLLHAFLKKKKRTPRREIMIAEKNYTYFIHIHKYDY